ncbi:MAG: T9SS type A sorting domain-containing protein [Luteibaculum sp.]
MKQLSTILFLLGALVTYCQQQQELPFHHGLSPLQKAVTKSKTVNPGYFKTGILRLDSVKVDYNITDPQPWNYRDTYTYNSVGLTQSKHEWENDVSWEHFHYNDFDSIIKVVGSEIYSGDTFEYRQNIIDYDTEKRRVKENYIKYSYLRGKDTSQIRNSHIYYTGASKLPSHRIDSIRSYPSLVWRVYRTDYSYNASNQETYSVETNLISGDTIFEVNTWYTDGKYAGSKSVNFDQVNIDSFHYDNGILLQADFYYGSETVPFHQESRTSIEYDQNNLARFLYLWGYDEDAQELRIVARYRIQKDKGKKSDYPSILEAEDHSFLSELTNTVIEQMDQEVFENDWTKVGEENYHYSLSSNINEKSAVFIQAFPNPAQNSIQFSEISGSVSYTVFDQAGRIVLQGKSSTAKIPVSILKPGTYHLKMSTSNQTYSARFIKE